MTQAVADELAIRQLVAAYADAVNRRDESLWASTWAEDGVWDLRGNVVEGREAVVALWNTAMGGFSFVAQLVYQGTLEIDGDRATGRWYLSEHLRPVDAETGRFTIGSYADEYTRVGGEWKFARRSYDVLYSDETSGAVAGSVLPFPRD